MSARVAGSPMRDARGSSRCARASETNRVLRADILRVTPHDYLPLRGDDIQKTMSRGPSP